jgi:hypothetical protein
MSETRLLSSACAAALQQGDTERLRAWCTQLAPGQRRREQLEYRLHPRRITYATAMIRAAGLALAARSLTPVALKQPSALHDLCTWVDEDVARDELAETLVTRLAQRQTTPSADPPSVAGSCPDAVQRFALLCLDTLCDVLRDKAVMLGDKAVLSPECIALLRACARDWLGASSAGICYEVPIAYVVPDEDGQEQEMVDHTLVVELLTPGHGQTIQYPEDVFLLPEQPTSAPKRGAPASIDESFLNAIQYAFQAACTLAQCHDIDARWRLLRGPARQPVITATGESASGQALRAFYGALTDTRPDAGVIVLAQVTRAGQLREVAGVGAKTRAIVQAVHARRMEEEERWHANPMVTTPPGSGDPGQCDTIVIASQADHQEAAAALQACQAERWVRVVRVRSVEAACRVRSQLARDLLRYYKQLLDGLDRTPWLHGGVPLRARTVAIPIRVRKRVAPRPALARPGYDGRQYLLTAVAAADGNPESDPLYNQRAPDAEYQEVAWSEEHQRVHRAIVLGGPGDGKSFLTQVTAITLVQEALMHLRTQRVALDTLPLLVHLSLDRLVQQERLQLSDVLIARLQEQYGLSPRLEAWMRQQMPTAYCWLILDALDQVALRDGLFDYLKALETKAWKSHVLLTCRTANYDRAQIPWCVLSEYALAPFNAAEVRQFVTQWFADDGERGESLHKVLAHNVPLSHACRSPLLATLTCLAHAERTVTAGTRRVDLYAWVLRGLVRRAWRKNPLPLQEHRIDKRLRLAQELA